MLPKDFSTSLVESVTGTSKQPKIKYYVNEKKNAIAPKITDTGATTIDEQINSAFVTTVATTVASAVSEAEAISTKPPAKSSTIRSMISIR